METNDEFEFNLLNQLIENQEDLSTSPGRYNYTRDALLLHLRYLRDAAITQQDHDLFSDRMFDVLSTALTSLSVAIDNEIEGNGKEKVYKALSTLSTKLIHEACYPKGRAPAQVA